MHRKGSRAPQCGLRLALTLALILALVPALACQGCTLAPRQAGPPEPARHANGQTDLATLTGPLRVHIIDVGQGDSILIEIPNGQAMLIDAGEAVKGPSVTRYLKDRGLKGLDYLVATHPHSDHIGGLAEVLRSFPVSSVFMPRTGHTTTAYESLLKAVKNEGLSITEARAGQKVLTASNLKIEFIAPSGSAHEEINDWSGILMIQYGDTSFLLMGDATAVSEGEILAAANPPARVDVLKVAHHGGNTGTTARFLKAISPRYAAISVGYANPYGHPSKDTLARLKNAGVKVFRTDVHGTITFESDGKSITVSTEKAGN